MAEEEERRIDNAASAAVREESSYVTSCLGWRSSLAWNVAGPRIADDVAVAADMASIVGWSPGPEGGEEPRRSRRCDIVGMVLNLVKGSGTYPLCILCVILYIRSNKRLFTRKITF